MDPLVMFVKNGVESTVGKVVNDPSWILNLLVPKINTTGTQTIPLKIIQNLLMQILVL